MPSLRMVPGPASSSSISVGDTTHATHAGIHDTMRFGHRNIATEASSLSRQHPMQHRLEQWDETRDNLKLTMQRNMFGLAAPLRTMMERKVVGQVCIIASGRTVQIRNRSQCVRLSLLFYRTHTFQPCKPVRWVERKDCLVFIWTFSMAMTRLLNLQTSSLVSNRHNHPSPG